MFVVNVCATKKLEKALLLLSAVTISAAVVAEGDTPTTLTVTFE
jgi:hypothetical protein